MNKKSNDHWVSQFLLKSFVRDGQLWIYDKITKRRIRRPTKAICCEEGFTTFSPNEIPPGIEILKDGKFLEIELSKWEREQSLTIAKLMEHRTIESISAEEFWELGKKARVYSLICAFVMGCIWTKQAKVNEKQPVRKVSSLTVC